MKKNTLLLIGLLLSTTFTMFAQQTLKGIVLGKATGEALPGVSVIVKGTVKGTDTDFDGKFELPNLKSGDILVFMYLGYLEQEVIVSTSFDLLIELEESSEQLDEIIVIGYGTTTVKDATGSVESITAKDFTKGNIVTPENLLSGRVAGVNVTTSGSPGSGSQIVIRGGSSLTASSAPLIVIDGLPISNSTANGTRGILSSINPNDIESFSVLKDASATAIYGSRAANGVIIIVTKKGKAGFSLEYDFQYSAGEVLDRVDVFSADAYRVLINSQPISGVTLDTALLGTANTDWQDEVLQNTVSTQHSITAKGQILNKIPTRLSVGFSYNEGSILTSQFDRANVSLAMNPSFLDNHLKVSLNYNRAFTNNRFANNTDLRTALRYDPTQPVRAAGPYGGFYQHYTGGSSNFVLANGGTNPVAQLLQNNRTGKSFRQYGNLNLDYKFHFLPELKFVVNVGLDRTEGTYRNIGAINGPRSFNSNFSGNNEFGSNNIENQLLDTYFNYTNKFNNFKTDVTAGYSYQKFTGNGFNSGNLFDPTATSDTFKNDPVVLIGFFGRANFTFLEKYLVTLSYRRDGTSRFGPDNKWGDFPAAAVAWQIGDEDFLKDSNVVSSLKLRASYGITGQQDIGTDTSLYLDKYRFGNTNSQFQFGNQVIQSTIPQPINEDVKWEETATLELAIDYGLFANKFSGSLGVFQKNSTDLLFRSPIADATNYTNSITRNIGELQVRGIEFSLNADLFKSENFSWNANFNATYLEREITSLPLGIDLETGGIAGGTGTNIQIMSEGHAPNSFYVYKQLYDTTGQPIEGAYADINGDGVFSADDRYIKENGLPDVTLGFQSSFNYKNIDLAFNLRASIGNYAYNNVDSSLAQYALLQDQSVLGNIPTAVLDHNFTTTSDVITSDIYLENASFLRMDNITIGYTFNPLLKKFKTNSIRLWAGVQNVFTVTNYSGLDPDIVSSNPGVPSNGIDNLTFPRSRTFLLGANIKF